MQGSGAKKHGKRGKKTVSPMGFVEFSEKYATEEACREKLFAMRWPEGFKCPKCGCEEYHYLRTRGTYQCKACKHQTSLIVGTVMERSHLKLKIWFWAIYVVATDKRGCSAVYLQKQLHIGYKSAWYLLHRIREAMRHRDEK